MNIGGLPVRDWRLLTLLLCFYGFWAEMRPITPFLTPYLVSAKNLTHQELYGSVFPVWTYSSVLLLVPVFVLTDLLGCKPLLLSSALGYIATWLLLIWGSGIPAMQLMQVAFGWSQSAEVAYYAYIYSVVEPKRYQKATSSVRAAALVGKCAAYGLAQVLVSTGAGSLMDLNYISFAAVILIFFLALLLPHTVERHVPPEADGIAMRPLSGDQNKRRERKVSEYFRTLLGKFRRCYGDKMTLKWSLWWALGTCGYYQVASYVQTLWDEWLTDDGAGNLYNGLAEALSTILGAGTAMGVGWLSLAWTNVGELVLGSASILQGGLLLYAATATTLAPVYVAYVLFYLLYQMLITVATFNVASRIEKDSYGLVFGWNTFMALVVQSLLTFAVTDRSGLNLPIRQQFLVYGGWHAVLGACFLLSAVLTFHSLHWHCPLRLPPVAKIPTDASLQSHSPPPQEAQ